MKRIAITGASGFVGANLVRRLLRDGHDVHVLLRRKHDPWRLKSVKKDLRTHLVELGSPDQIDRVVRDIHPEWIFHLAVHGAYSWETKLSDMIETNFIGTVNLVRACLKIGFEAFINTGSSSEYGVKDHAPAENEALDPNSDYAVTKVAATCFCRQAARERSVKLPTLRLYSVYGAYEEPRRLIPSLIIRGLKGEWPPLVNPEVARDYIHVDDVVEAYLAAATRPTAEQGAVYNVGTGTQTSLSELVEIARRTLGITAEPVWNSMPPRLWDTDVWIANTTKIRQELEWEPCTTIAAGFQRTLEWFRDHPEIVQFYEKRASGSAGATKL